MKVAKAYARALYLVAQEKTKGPSIMEQISQQLKEYVAIVLGSKEATIAFLSPATSTKQKQDLLEVISKKAQTLPLVTQFVQLVASKGRLAILSEIQECFERVRWETEGGVMGWIESADPLSSEDVEEMSLAYAKKLGKKISFQIKTDPNLLAGLRVVVNGVTYDGTLRTQLQKVIDRLMV